MNVRLRIDRLVVDESLLDGRTPRAFQREFVAAVERLILDGGLDPTRLRGGARARVPWDGARRGAGDPVDHLARALLEAVGDG